MTLAGLLTFCAVYTLTVATPGPGVAAVVVQPAVLIVYVLLAAKARTLFTSARAVQNLNRSASVAMAGAAVAVATR